MATRDMVDILLATYNAERYLPQQLESIRRQTFGDWKLLISDDGSTDHTAEIIERYCEQDERIHRIQTGIAHGSPKYHFLDLLRYSNSDYFGFSDQDDVWLPKKLEMSMNLIQAMEVQFGTQTPLMVYGDMKVVNSQLQVISDSFYQYSGLGQHSGDFGHLLSINLAAGCTMVGNRALRDSICELTPHVNDDRIIMHDWWVALVAAGLGAVRELPEVCSLYRQHDCNNLGAQRYSAFNIVHKMANFRNSRRMYAQTCEQARLLEAIYGTTMDEARHRQLVCYYSASAKGGLSGAAALRKNNLLKIPITQRIGQICFVLLGKR